MSTINREFVGQMLGAFMDKDIETVLGFFTDDAVVVDQHYPVREMKGKAALRQGFDWAFKTLKKPGFTIRHLWIEDDTVAVEIDTHHVLNHGPDLNFPQVFVFETCNNLISRMQCYAPYGPPGIGGLLTKLTRLIWRIQGKAK